MKKSQLRKIIKEEIKSTLNEDNDQLDRYNDDREQIKNIDYSSTFTRNAPARIDQFINKLHNLIEEYHAELYLKDGVFTGMEAVKSAALGPDTAQNPE